MKILVGTSGYAYKEWKGSFYPEKIPTREMLRFYAERFDTVEINYTFHHMPTAKVLSAWADRVPADFAFSLKAPQVITHHKRLRNVAEESDYFFKTLAVLGRNLGPVLFQFPPGFHADPALLVDFLARIPAERDCAFEFRHPSWLTPQILDLLRAQGCSLCTADSDEQPATEIISTAPWGYLRLRRSSYSDEELRQWQARILARKWRRAYVYFKHEDTGGGAETAMRFRAIAGGGSNEPRRKGGDGHGPGRIPAKT